MAWDFLTPEWRELLRPKLEEAEQLIAGGTMTRAQAEAIVRSMREIALAESAGIITEAQALDLVAQSALVIAGQRRAN
jgi:hypothetical protein